MLSNDMQQNLAWIAGIPRGRNDMQVRIHWLLDLVKADANSNGSIFYDFTRLDQFLDALVERNGLNPGFELMGNPSNVFTDFEDRKQVFMWKNFVAEISKRYIGKYGIGRVKNWNFESWNEPVLKHFDGLNMTIKGFLNYYDACSNGLRQSDEALRFGGPGGECYEPSAKAMCWALLEHCNNGTDYFTQRKGPLRLDFISLHKKGDGVSHNVLTKELHTLEEIYTLYTNLRKTPVFNDEADPIVTWSAPYWWNQDATYAAIATKILVQHIHFYYLHLKGAIPFELLSNDNAFLSYYPHAFSQRTLLARFQMNNTCPPHVQLIRKPIHAVTGIWNSLGSVILYSKIRTLGEGILENSMRQSQLGAVATLNGNITGAEFQVAVLIYNSMDSQNVTGITNISLTVHLPFNFIPVNAVWVQYTVDNVLTNPFIAWARAGMPDYPSKDTFHEMRQKEEPHRHGKPLFLEQTTLFKTNISLRLPGATLVHICQQKDYPEQVQNVDFLEVFQDQVLITWKGLNNKCILTYEVEFSALGDHFQRINDQDTIFSSYHHTCSQGHCDGYYRVRCVDYWNRPGPYSKQRKH